MIDTCSAFSILILCTVIIDIHKLYHTELLPSVSLFMTLSLYWAKLTLCSSFHFFFVCLFFKSFLKDRSSSQNLCTFSSCRMSLRFVSLSFVYPQKDPTVLTSLHEVLQQFGWGQISQLHPSLQLVGPHFFRGGIACDMKTGATGTLLKKKGEAVQPFLLKAVEAGMYWFTDPDFRPVSAVAAPFPLSQSHCPESLPSCC